MSSRTPATILFAVLLGLLPSTVATACSDEPPRSEGDAGNDAASPDGNRPAPLEDAAEAPKSCRERCEVAHPTGLRKDEAINSCWETHCLEPCIEELPSDAGAEAGAGVDAGACISPVVTVSSACDECTMAACCAAWDACFQDPECAALNACYRDCAE